MNNLVQCTRCNKVLVNEEYDDHICMPEIKSFKTIKFTDYCISKDRNGKTVINIITKSGLDLECIEIPENKEYTKVPYTLPSTENLHRDDSTDDFTGTLTDKFIKNEIAINKYENNTDGGLVN